MNVPLLRISPRRPSLVLASVLALGAAAAPQDPGAAKARRAAVPFELDTSTGGTWSLRDHDGDVIVLEWIDPECPMVTRQHSPEGTIGLVRQQTSGDGAVTWLALNSSHRSTPQSGAEVTEAARERLRIDYPVALDPTGWVGRAYGVERATHVVVIDPDGQVAYSGAPDDADAQDRLMAAIELAAGRGDDDVEAVPPRGCAVRYAPDVRVGSALPPTVLPLGGDLTVRNGELLGAPLVLEWAEPASDAWRAAHGEGGALAAEPGRWDAEGARWMLVHPCAALASPTLVPAYEERVEEAFAAACPVGRTVHDFGHRLTDAFGATRTPEVYVVDARGVVVYAGAHDGRTEDGAPILPALRRALADPQLPLPAATVPPTGDPIVR